MKSKLEPILGMECEGLRAQCSDAIRGVFAVAFEKDGWRVFYTDSCDNSESKSVLELEGECASLSVTAPNGNYVLLGTSKGELLKSKLGSGSYTKLSLGSKMDDIETKKPVSIMSRNDVDGKLMAVSRHKYVII